MKVKILLCCLFILMLSNCGSSKKTVKSKTKTTHKEIESKVENLPDVHGDEHIDKLEEGSKRLNENSLEYIKKYAAIAVREMHLHSIPASITLAQGVLESGSGRSELASKSNNHFGIKCHTDWQGKRVYHDDDEKGECFRKYKYVSSSFKDHSLFLTQRKRYAFLFTYRVTDYKKWAKGLRKAGYATDPRYPAKLIRIIEDYKLHDFDRIKQDGFKYESNIEEGEEDNNEEVHFYTVKKGDTLYSIARKFKVSVARLKQINNLRDNIININQVLKTE
ncbi:Flagellum-specific peptidoglycan hydrolase FlgJ [Polaribacter sp. KT25b]|uniref:glucosaminidase domain-containing protein n=1 Tax=Polaribacter sp. KT25b TaxID=1855336 RepID=UPI00087C6A9A|nr:glucosaminidase domain-containing protein [Polaribacter sp. KT25b]SDR67771.1 Flagellum-specific peptidoglycan hydrolase FlgJ [Polaribacter sp. KT25b]